MSQTPEWTPPIPGFYGSSFRLGEWISLGGTSSVSNSSQGGFGRSHTSRESVERQIEVLVKQGDEVSREPLEPEPAADSPPDSEPEPTLL